MHSEVRRRRVPLSVAGEPGPQGRHEIAAAGGIVLVQGPQQPVGEGPYRIVREEGQDGARDQFLAS
nr:hypothetical protein [Streptomyces tsukubensis NRRL18488]